MSLNKSRFRLLTCLAAVAVAPFTLAQSPDQGQRPGRGNQPPAGAGGGDVPFQGGGRQARPAAPRPYEEVITADAKSDEGVFTVHRIDDRILFEIPKNQLDKEMLLATEIEGVPAGYGYGGTAAGHKVVRWTRRGNVVFLRVVDYSIRAEGKGAIARAVQSASLEPIVAAFNVEAEGKGGTAVVDVTRFFTSDPTEFAVKNALGGGQVDPTRSFIEKTKSFPTNIEVKSTMTFTGGTGPGGGGPGGGGGGGRRGGAPGSVTALVHYSLVLLPEKPMMPREYDSRVGYFTEGFDDYGLPENRVVSKEYIARYRLEKKDPSAALSEPVKPIVYYISREVPEFLHPYLKRAVEDWNVAFEAAGFKNAILCKDAPDDPNWDPEDARYSVIRWAPTPTENAQGPHISDPRTGEILSAHIIVWHNVMKLGQTWYFTQVADLDPAAARLPLPEPLVGRIMQYVVSHEVGHTLGLRHNHKASSSYTAAQLRSKAFTDKYGDEASIMDYGRFNYVAQTGDNARLIPIIGPYDKFAIQWGYEPLKPSEEKAALDLLAAKQVKDPTLRFGGEDLNAQSDPTVQTEDLGSDPIEATRYGLINIAKIAKMLVPATTKHGESYDLLQEMYGELLSQRAREFAHVVKLVGGVVQTDYHAGRGGLVYAPVPAAKQAQAVRFLVENAFATPTNLLLPDILYRIQAAGVQDQVLGGQRNLLAGLLSDARIGRLLDAESLAPGQTYTLSALVRDLQGGIWSEVSLASPRVDPYRRNLQRAYLETVKAKLQADDATPSDLRPVLTANLIDLRTTISRALAKTTDPTTRMHLIDCRTAIGRILNPPAVVVQPAPAAAPAFPGRRGG